MSSVTLKVLAERTGYSIGAVSMALRDDERIATSTREAIRKVAEELNYRPNLAARALAGGRTGMVGVLKSHLRDQFHVDVLAGLEAAVGEAGYTMLLALTGSDARLTVERLEHMARRGVDGVVLEGCVISPALGKRLEALRAAGVAVVLQNMDMPDGKFDRVTIEMPRNSAKVVRHLIELGHRRIALIRRPDDRWRLEGYRAALAEFGIAFDERLILDFTPETDPPSWARERLLSLKNRPTAVFAMSDRLAGEIVLDLLEAGWRVPGDVSVAAINDLWYTPALRVPLTTLRVPVKRIGRECGRLLLERIRQPGKPFEEVEIEGELVVRESTAAPAC